MYDFFESLDDKKKKRIIEGCIDEFANYGYDNSSTNRIVQKVGISKGSLFNYFNSKEGLYFYVLDYAVKVIQKEMASKISDLPEDLFERIYRIAEMEYELYIRRPKIYNLFRKALTSENKELIDKIKDRYSLKSSNLFDKLLGDYDSYHLVWEKDKIINIIKWVLEGLNDEFLLNKNNNNIINEKDRYLEELSSYIEILKEGIKVPLD